MEKDYSRLFQKLAPVRTPENLSAVILARVEREQQRAARVHLIFSVPLAFISATAVVISFQYLAQEIARSGILEYFSVLFSDGGSILTYWKEFVLSLAEQTPVLGATLFLGALLALLGSLKAIAKNIQTGLTYA